MEWFKQDQMLLSWLFSSLTEEIFPHVIGLTTANEVWIALAQTFGSMSQNRQLQSHIELQEFKRNDTSMSEYLQKVKAKADELKAAGKPLSLAEFNAIIYRNIGVEYHTIITTLNLRLDPVSFHELHGQLVAHEHLLQGLHTPQANLVLETPASSVNRSSSYLSSRPRYGGYTGPWISNHQRPRGPCQICGKGNHTAATCRNRFAPRTQQTFSSYQPRSFRPRYPSPEANYVHSFFGSSPPPWPVPLQQA
jgi:hypothetical protein